MPIYEYLCASCGFQQEYLLKMNDAPLTECPECGKATFGKMVTAAGFHLKGSGWYATDFKHGAKQKPKPADEPATKAEDSTAAKAEDKSAAKVEDKSGAKVEDKPAGKPDDKRAPKSDDKSAPEAANKSDAAASTAKPGARASSVSG